MKSPLTVDVTCGHCGHREDAAAFTKRSAWVELKPNQALSALRDRG